MVLAGGRSTRFGADKLAADLHGVPLLQHAVGRLAEVCDEVVVVLAPGAAAPALATDLPVRFAYDAREGEGPLAGLAAGLAAVTTDRSLAVAGDMPELAPAVLTEMLRVAREAPVDAVALADRGRVSPLPCVVSVEVARANAHALLGSGERSLRALIDSLRVAVIDEPTWVRLDPARGSLRDVDVPGDLTSGQAGSIG